MTGILLGCCLLLLVAIGFTVAELAGYSGGPPVAEVPAVEEQREAPAAEPEGTEETGGIFYLAPADAQAAAVIDPESL